MSETVEEGAAKGASGLKSAFSKRIGPLPVGVWVAIIGGGLGIAWFSRSRTGAVVDPGTAELDNTAPTAGNLYVPDDDTNLGAGGLLGSLFAGTNEQWGALGLNRLTSLGYSSTAADQAIRKYLDGTTLTAVEANMIDKLLQSLGSPPTPPPLPTSGQVVDRGTGTGLPRDDQMPTPAASPAWFDISNPVSADSTSSYRDQPGTTFVAAPASSPAPASGTVNVISNQVSQNWAGQYMIAGRAVSPSEIAALRSGATSLGGYGAESTAEIRKAAAAAGLL